MALLIGLLFLNIIINVHGKFYKQKDADRMIEKIDVSHSGDAATCYMYYGDSTIIRRILDIVPSDLIRVISKEEMKQFVNNCTNSLVLDNSNMDNELETSYNYIRNIFGRFSIYPGTKWCGAGNIADDYDDLGTEVETDKCCRTHDHCNTSIPGYEEGFGLKNKNFYTKSHCKCDNEFHSCLSKVQTSTSNSVGNLFFNVLQIECFKKEYPIVRCVKATKIRNRCLKYRLDETKPKKYQFFDAKKFPEEDESHFV